MPAKKIISKEMILIEAINLIEEEGTLKLNARNLANRLNCSTQPIYHSFINMDDLFNQVKLRIRDDYIIFLNDSIKKETNYFFGNLLGMINYAYLHPKLFEIIYMRPFLADETNLELNENIINGIMKIGYTHEDATNFFYQSWIFAYGIAVQIVTGYLKWNKEDIVNILNLQFEALKKYYRKDK